MIHFLFPVYMTARFWWSLITLLAKYGHRSYFKWYRQIKDITEGLKVCRRFFLKFFFQEFKQKYILKRIKKKYFALKLNSVRIGKCDLVVNIFSWTILNNSFCKLDTWVFASSYATTIIRFEHLQFIEVLLCLKLDGVLDEITLTFKQGSCKKMSELTKQDIHTT